MKKQEIEICKKFCKSLGEDCEHCPRLFNTCVDCNGSIKPYYSDDLTLVKLREHIKFVKKWFKELKKNEK